MVKESFICSYYINYNCHNIDKQTEITIFSLEICFITLAGGNRDQNGGRSPILGIWFGFKHKICQNRISETKVNGRQVNQAKKRTSKKVQTPKLAQNGMFILRS